MGTENTKEGTFIGNLEPPFKKFNYFLLAAWWFTRCPTLNCCPYMLDAPQKLFCNNPFPRTPVAIYTLPHMLLRYSLPPPPPIDHSTLTQTKGGTNLDLHWGSDSQKSKLKVPSSPWWVVVISQGPSPAEVWGQKTIFTVRSNVFTLLQAMTKNNNVPRIDVGLALLCQLFIYLFIY
jgi:hypothetical protein